MFVDYSFILFDKGTTETRGSNHRIWNFLIRYHIWISWTRHFIWALGTSLSKNRNYFWISLWIVIASIESETNIGFYARRSDFFIFLMVSLILKTYKAIAFVVGAIISEIHVRRRAYQIWTWGCVWNKFIMLLIYCLKFINPLSIIFKYLEL